VSSSWCVRRIVAMRIGATPMSPAGRLLSMWTVILAGCTGGDQAAERQRPAEAQPAALSEPEQFQVEAERFADLRVLRYRVPGFEALEPQTKELLYYLYEAALSGREIIYDQKYRYNLAVKRTLEEIVRHYPGERSAPE